METNMKAITGPNWFQMALVRPSWPHLVQVCPVWPYFALFGPVGPDFALFDPICSCLGPFGSVLTCFDLFGPVRPVFQKSHYDLRYYIKSTKYGQEMCSFATNMHKFVLVFNGKPGYRGPTQPA